jgi:TolA-binding protein
LEQFYPLAMVLVKRAVYVDPCSAVDVIQHGCNRNGDSFLADRSRWQKRGQAFKSAPPPLDVKKRQDESKPVNPDELKKYAERDTRKTRLQARARALLITEIQGLERLYKNTPDASADKPQLTRRLAEAYVELESAALRDKIASDIQAQDAKAKKQNATKFRSDAAAAEKIVKAARTNAIKYYTTMKDKYPKYSKIDEVLYYLAYEHEQAQSYDKAREVYLELIDKAPKSPYIPNAYLAFGELFFQEAQGDPAKWDLAAAAYKEVIKYPPPNNKVYGYARYKLGYVHWNKGDYANALNEFKKVIEYGDGFSELPNAKQLAKSARRDCIPVYAVSGALGASVSMVLRTLSHTLYLVDSLGQSLNFRFKTSQSFMAAGKGA